MSDFITYLHELFADFAPIQAKRMFGGYGIYRDELMFGLVADDTLYLKTDEQSRDHFEAAGMTPFEYTKNGKTMQLSYFQAPAEAMDNADEATRWATLAYDAALRARAARKPSVRRTAKPENKRNTSQTRQKR